MTSASPWVPNGQTELRALPSSFRVYHFPESFRKQVQADPVPLYLADAEGEDPPASKMATTRLPAVIWTEPAAPPRSAWRSPPHRCPYRPARRPRTKGEGRCGNARLEGKAYRRHGNGERVMLLPSKPAGVLIFGKCLFRKSPAKEAGAEHCRAPPNAARVPTTQTRRSESDRCACGLAKLTLGKFPSDFR